MQTQHNRFINPLPGVPCIESPFFEKIFNQPEIDEETRRVARELHTRGFAVIEFPDAELEMRAEAIKRRLHDRYDWNEWRGSGFQSGLRIQDAWQFDENVKQLACNQRILQLLSTLYGAQAFPFQTLNFPVGTQQHFHSDSVHFSSVPERFMCGVWTALEDVVEGAGPLIYYPGSHKWPIYANEHIGHCVSAAKEAPGQELYEGLWHALIDVHDAKPEIFLAKKGQALIWTANLLHGGAPQTDRSKTRWSQVTHYYFKNCAYYTPLKSDPFYGRIAFRNIADIATGATVPNQYAGHPIPEQFISETTPGGKSRLAPEGSVLGAAKKFAAKVKRNVNRRILSRF
jgi:hypothetical protein